MLTNKADLPVSQIDNGNFALYSTLLLLGSSRTVSQEAQFQALQTTLELYLLSAQDYNVIIAEFGVLKSTILTELAQQQLLLLATVERLNTGQQFANLTGYGAFTIFNSGTDESIDFGGTTANIDTGSETCTWDNTGTEILSMADITRANVFNSINLRVYSDDLKIATVDTVMDTTNISVSTNNYTLTTADKLVKDNVEIGINSVSGGQSNVVYTNEVANAQNNTSGKNAVQFNGLRHFVTRESTGLKLYRADSATTETLVASISTDVTNVFSVGVASVSGNKYLFVTWGIAGDQKAKGYDKDYTVVQAEIILDNVVELEETIINIEGNKTIVSNISKTVSLPLSFNARVGTYTIDLDGSLSVDIAFSQATTSNTNTNNYKNISITYVNGLLGGSVIFNVGTSNQTLYRYIERDSGGSWTPITIKTTTLYVSSKATLIKKSKVSNLDRLIIAIEKTTGLISILYSDNNGVSWLEVELGTGANPQLTENLAGDIHITYEDAGAIKTIEIANGSTTPETPEILVARVGEEYYTLGNEEIPTSGGYSSTNNAGTISNFFKQATQLNLQALAASGTALAKRVVASELAVDVTNLNRLYVDWTHSNSPENNGHSRVFALTQTRTSDYNVANAVSLTGGGTLARSTQSIDVGGLTGSYYIKLAVVDSARVGGSFNTLLVHNIFSSSIVNPKTDGKATDYIKPVCTYDGFGLAGEELIGAGFELELASAITVIPTETLVISTQYAPKQGVTDIPYYNSGSNFLEYQLTGLSETTSDITIGNTLNEVVSNLVTWNAI